MCRNDRKDWMEDEVTKEVGGFGDVVEVVVEKKNGFRFRSGCF